MGHKGGAEIPTWRYLGWRYWGLGVIHHDMSLDGLACCRHFNGKIGHGLLG